MFFHHIALFKAVLRFLNANAAWLRLSLRSTRLSICSPRSNANSTGITQTEGKNFTNVFGQYIFGVIQFMLSFTKGVTVNVVGIKVLLIVTLVKRKVIPFLLELQAKIRLNHKKLPDLWLLPNSAC